MMKILYILFLISSANLIIFAQDTEPLISTQEENQECYGNRNYGYYGNNNIGNRWHHNNGYPNRGHGHHNNGYPNRGHGHHNNGYPNRGHGHHNNRYPNRGHGHRYIGYCNYVNHSYNWVPVSISIFDGCCQRIRYCRFESDRLREAMFFVDNNYVNAHQVANIMRFFDFESTRLEFAKYAFHKTCDVQNYGVVFGELTYSSSREELDCYIRDYIW